MNSEAIIRISFFLGIFIVLAIGELWKPRRELNTSKKSRWFSNLSIVFINSALIRLAFPVLPAGIALLAKENNAGLLNNLNLPYWLAIVAGVIGLDFIIYIQHVLFHSIPAFWSLHKVHHTDLDFDVTTGIRFHPIEIILSTGIKLGAVYLFGAPVLAAIIFAVLLNGTSMFNHSNIRLPLNIDRIVRLLVVTPDMHRVHHSVKSKEGNSNFGFNLPWWDRLLSTYRAQPEEGHEDMTIGLSSYRDSKKLTLPRLLALPFIDKPKSQKEQ